MKKFVRGLIPAELQVPCKYWYGLARGHLEREMKLLSYLVNSGDHVLDIGGNRGAYSYLFWKLGARVEVFEPNQECASVLDAWAAGKGSVNVHRVALSSKAGVANLHIPIDDGGVEHDASASLEKSHSGRFREEVVPLETLDSFGFSDVKFIKIDVEGHERDVLEGASATVASSRPAMVVEIEQRHNAAPIEQIFASIESFGYVGFYLKESRLVPLSNFDVSEDQSMDAFISGTGYYNNFLFIHTARLNAGEYGELQWMWTLG